MDEFKDTTVLEIDQIVHRSAAAFSLYRRSSPADRSALLYAIADELKSMETSLIRTAAMESHLDEARLAAELRRTRQQLTSYGDACASGLVMDIRIHPRSADNKQDLRKMMVPLGPVVVFGASNFPFAYSTAGGDTACALAAGCTVIVKAHPAHPKTSGLTAAAIKMAIKKTRWPEDIFQHVYGSSFETGQALVMHPLTKAVGFTGSFAGGKALFDLAVRRPEPIPVFAEMGSVNPVFMLPGKIRQDREAVVSMYAASITQSAGQFCTNPGILVVMEHEDYDQFIYQLGNAIQEVVPHKMLHEGIAEAFHTKRSEALQQKGVRLIAQAEHAGSQHSLPTLAEVCAGDFLTNPKLHEEVFGTFSLVVKCNDIPQMEEIALSLKGQLTATLMATKEEAAMHHGLMAILQEVCGRLILNGVPTGVEVDLAMHHGGPFPATTDSRFTAVGADGIRRFCRPLCYQNWEDSLLPPELQNNNPYGLWRTIYNEVTRSEI